MPRHGMPWLLGSGTTPVAVRALPVGLPRSVPRHAMPCLAYLHLQQSRKRLDSRLPGCPEPLLSLGSRPMPNRCPQAWQNRWTRVWTQAAGHAALAHASELLRVVLQTGIERAWQPLLAGLADAAALVLQLHQGALRHAPGRRQRAPPRPGQVGAERGLEAG
jgi:hypothetical protein